MFQAALLRTTNCPAYRVEKISDIYKGRREVPVTIATDDIVSRAGTSRKCGGFTHHSRISRHAFHSFASA